MVSLITDAVVTNGTLPSFVTQSPSSLEGIILYLYIYLYVRVLNYSEKMGIQQTVILSIEFFFNQYLLNKIGSTNYYMLHETLYIEISCLSSNNM